MGCLSVRRQIPRGQTEGPVATVLRRKWDRKGNRQPALVIQRAVVVAEREGRCAVELLRRGSAGASGSSSSSEKDHSSSNQADNRSSARRGRAVAGRRRQVGGWTGYRCTMRCAMLCDVMRSGVDGGYMWYIGRYASRGERKRKWNGSSSSFFS